MKRFMAVPILCFLSVFSLRAGAENTLAYGPFSYDFFMRAEEGTARECAITFTYDKNDANVDIDSTAFDRLVTEVSGYYAQNIDHRLGMPYLSGFSDAVSLLVPYDCQNRLAIGEQIARIGNRRQNDFQIKVIPLIERDPNWRANEPIRVFFGASREEWRLRQQAVQNPCNSDNWRQLAKYYREKDLREIAHIFSGNPANANSRLFLIYAMIIDGSTLDEAGRRFFDDPRALQVVADFLRPQMERVKC